MHNFADTLVRLGGILNAVEKSGLLDSVARAADQIRANEEARRKNH